MNNYEFCAKWVINHAPSKTVRVLDYGCGSGQIIKELRMHEIEAFGCDVFYEGGDYSSSIDPTLLSGGTIKRMNGDLIPFESSLFDIVINNQVMEHVENLESVLAEIQRVLKPGGQVLSLFPDKGVWREGHCGIPFLHWFPKYSHIRIYYAASLRVLGFGYHKGSKSVIQWSRDFCDWLDKWTHYRTRKEVDTTYGNYFTGMHNIEDYWLKLRLGKRKFIISWLPASIQRVIVQKLGGIVFVATKSI